MTKFLSWVQTSDTKCPECIILKFKVFAFYPPFPRMNWKVMNCLLLILFLETSEPENWIAKNALVVQVMFVNRSCTARKGLRFISNLHSNIFALKAVSRTVVQVMCAYLVEKQKSRQIFQTERSKFSQFEGIDSLKAFMKDYLFTSPYS